MPTFAVGDPGGGGGELEHEADQEAADDVDDEGAHGQVRAEAEDAPIGDVGAQPPSRRAAPAHPEQSLHRGSLKADQCGMAEGCEAVVPTTSSGLLERLFAVYRRSVLGPVRELLAGGRRSVVGLVSPERALHPRVQQECATNVNHG